eukprot:TRINITY_DN6651_c0_g1_i1.p1 TRINITY_DN6651_c0_g1~~TRINITY_DN6651_c0_g1_i1.p1  ORF type:complete len:764 (-),score=101.48 TRINITY_DN6651_c0_g1_i1:926-3217(-)
MARSQPIEDWLTESGKKYDEHKETLRAQRLAAEIRSLRSPKISDFSKELARYESRSVVQRVLTKDKEAKRKLAELKARQEASEVYSFKPMISPVADKHGSRKDQAKLNEEWVQRREAKLKAERDKKNAIVEPQKLEVSERSRLLAAKINRKQGMSLEDYLICCGKQRQLKLWMRVQDVDEHKPQITHFANSLKRTGDVHERLYSSASNRVSVDDSCVSELLALENSAPARRRHSLSATSSIEFPYSPAITSFAAGLARNGPVEVTLIQKHKMEKEKFEQKIREMEMQERARMTPAINTVSKELAESLPQSSRERLLQGTPTRQTTCRHTDETAYPFKPTINSKSQQLDTEKENIRQRATGIGSEGADRISHWKLRQEKTRAQIERLRHERELKLMSECTFAPKTKHTRDEPQKEIMQGDITERISLWQQHKMEKLAEEQRKKASTELEGCTFHPVVQTKSHVTECHSVYDTLGFEEFMARQNAARKKQQEKASVDRQNHTSRWAARITIPVEFNLSTGKPECATPDHTKLKRASLIKRQKEREREYFSEPTDYIPPSSPARSPSAISTNSDAACRSPHTTLAEPEVYTNLQNGGYYYFIDESGQPYVIPAMGYPAAAAAVEATQEGPAQWLTAYANSFALPPDKSSPEREAREWAAKRQGRALDASAAKQDPPQRHTRGALTNSSSGPPTLQGVPSASTSPSCSFVSLTPPAVGSALHERHSEGTFNHGDNEGRYSPGGSFLLANHTRIVSELQNIPAVSPVF